MTDPKLAGPEASPDQLHGAASMAPSTRRLGRKPLMIAAGSAALVAVVFAFAIQARSGGNAEAVPTAGFGDTGVAPAAVPDILNTEEAMSGRPLGATGIGGEGQPAEGQTTQMLSPGLEVTGQLPTGQDQTGTYVAGGAQAGPGYTQPGYNRHAPAWEAYQQRRADLVQNAYRAGVDATGAASTVEIRRDRPGQAPQAREAGGVAVGGAPELAMQGAVGGPGRGGRAPLAEDFNLQGDKLDFMSNSGVRPQYAEGRVEPLVSPNVVSAGSVIPAVLIGGINSDLPGQVVAQVSRNVYDSATGRRLLIPQGARLVGEYNSAVARGQERVQVAWNRLIYPDGASIDLGAMPATDAAGFTGLRDRVNNRTGQVWGNALLMSLFSAGIQLSQPAPVAGEAQTAGQTAGAAVGQQMAQTGQEWARRGMAVQPRLEIRVGAPVAVAVTQDLVLREWRPRR